MAVSGTQKFTPAFAMPVIAPPVAGADPVAHYAAVAAQCPLTFADVVTAPEAALALDPQQSSAPAPTAKGLAITIPNPSSALADLIPFNTLYALMGGALSYVRAIPDTATGSSIALAPFLVPPFSALAPAPKYPAPAGLDPGKAWGAFRLCLWGTDFDKLKEALGTSAACGQVYYFGVDEASAKAALKPLVELEYTQASYDQAVTQGKTPPFRLVVEGIKTQAYATAPTYATLVADFVTELFNGKTDLVVKGGSAIGQAVELTIASSGSNPAIVNGFVELWFADAAAPPAFIAPTNIIRGALAYDF